MKTIVNYVIASALLLLAACGGGNSLESKKAELEQLKTQQAEIAAKISTLQEELSKGGDTASTENLRAKFIAITPIKKQSFMHAIDIQGSVDGDENIIYSAKAPSSVTRILVKAGDKIQAGQLLAELDNKAAKAQLDGLKTQYELASTVFEKQKSLWDQKVGTEIQFLTAKATKEGLEKQILAAKEGLDMLQIKADYGGTVDEVNIKVGQNVAPGLPCISVINPDRLKIKANLSESYASQIKTGNPVDVNFPDINKNITAKISYASKTISAMTRTFNVEINLQNDADLYPNMVAKLKIVDYQNEQAVVVPINSIQEIDNQSVVFVAVKKGTELVAKKTIITVGKMYNGVAEVLSGLSEGDQLISVGFQDLTDGQAIKL